MSSTADSRDVGTRDRVAVVLDHEDDRQLVDAREVHRLVDVALVAGAFAGVGHRDLVDAADLGRPGDPGRVQDLRGHRRRKRQDVAVAIAVVAGHLATAGAGVACLGELGEHDLARGHAEGDQARDGAVIGNEPVEALAHAIGDRDLRALVALAADDEGDLAGAVEDPHALVQRPRERHQPVHLQQVVRSESQVRADGSMAAALWRRRLIAQCARWSPSRRCSGTGLRTPVGLPCHTAGRVPWQHTQPWFEARREVLLHRTSPVTGFSSDVEQELPETATRLGCVAACSASSLPDTYSES